MIKQLILKTSQYRYDGADRFDITRKNGNYNFAPSWNLIMGYKSKLIDEKKYRIEYKKQMSQSFFNNKREWEELLNKGEVTLVCFCKKGEFCHRLILVEILQMLGKRFNIEVIYNGEI